MALPGTAKKVGIAARCRTNGAKDYVQTLKSDKRLYELLVRQKFANFMNNMYLFRACIRSDDQVNKDQYALAGSYVFISVPTRLDLTNNIFEPSGPGSGGLSDDRIMSSPTRSTLQG